jgi:hypothetical protein
MQGTVDWRQFYLILHYINLLISVFPTYTKLVSSVHHFCILIIQEIVHDWKFICIFCNWIDITHATFTPSAPFLFTCTTCIGLYSPSWNCPKETVYQIISLQMPGISVRANILYVVTMFTFCLAYKNDHGLSAVISSWIQYTLHRQTKKNLEEKETKWWIKQHGPRFVINYYPFSIGQSPVSQFLSVLLTECISWTHDVEGFVLLLVVVYKGPS